MSRQYIYFICGVAGALVAYLGKDYTPSHPWTIIDKLNISTLICLIVSFLFGVGRILCYIQGISINKDVLVAQEEIGNFVNALTYRLENKDKGVPISINKKNGKASHSTAPPEGRAAGSAKPAQIDSPRGFHGFANTGHASWTCVDVGLHCGCHRAWRDAADTDDSR